MKMNVQTQFAHLCRDGELETAKKLLKNNPNINISVYDNQAFRWACANGQLHIAQWLLQVIPNINISVYSEFAFKFACGKGHLHVVQWLLQVKPDINISADNEEAFYWACKNKHLHVALYLQSLLPFKYNIQVKNIKIISFNFNTQREENLLFMLYSLTYKGFSNNLTANLVMNITKYI